ncbi:hypothetical protein Rsub_11461 [Raphidocelis subcapitata]|uniref:Uncharacterized protein n=1 Tax=Raphidocelis subcapitata TaxID=307507 RepID=A0A2V0PN79_9CHLO|nr:hypothetical protein Rsub_11461 [Raphidocelis subcapitata]|eukprot:GBF98857.1 hypothetical protein Rsub_11461 [Raphidocelis subcapitata]
MRRSSGGEHSWRERRPAAASRQRWRPEPRALPLLLLALAALLLGARGGAAFHDGDFIHTSRRSQYKQLRTNWRDLTEHHCPRFGRPRTVALPLLEPRGAEGEVRDYRLQLSFDGDRVVSPWVTVIGGRVAGMPLVRVELSRVGGELRGARVEVVPLPDEFLLSHADLYAAFTNASHWPKHVLVHYEWRAAPEAAADAGLFVMLAAGLLAAGAVSLSNLAGLSSRLAAFLADVAGDAPDSADPLLPQGLVGALVGGGGGGLGPAAFGGGGGGVFAPGGGGGGGGGGVYTGAAPYTGYAPASATSSAFAGSGAAAGLTGRFGPPAPAAPGGGGGAPYSGTGGYYAPPPPAPHAAGFPPPYKGAHVD